MTSSFQSGEEGGSAGGQHSNGRPAHHKRARSSDIGSHSAVPHGSIPLSHRGMDSRRDVIGQDALTDPVYDAEAFGPAAAAFARGRNKTLPDGRRNPDAFFTLEGYTLSFKSVRDKGGAVLDSWLAKVSVAENRQPGRACCFASGEGLKEPQPATLGIAKTREGGTHGQHG